MEPSPERLFPPLTQHNPPSQDLQFHLLSLQPAHLSWVMKLNPQQAPLYGDCVVTVLLAEEDKVEDDVVFYLVFSGSTLHHCTSTRKVSSDTLETIAPSHDCCETVQVLLCASKEGLPVSVVADADFSFVQDEACDAAQFLATSAGNQQALNFTRFLSRSGTPSADVDSLDEKVALAFRHLKLPADWNVLGTDQTLHDGGPRETLMHFAVRLGLLRLTWFLLQKPGGRGALRIHNQEGATPVSLALERGYHKLHQLLTDASFLSDVVENLEKGLSVGAAFQYRVSSLPRFSTKEDRFPVPCSFSWENAGEPDSWSSLSYEIPYGDCSVRHHRELDVYTLTSESQSPQEPLFPGDSCTGHIFKLMNIQQQLMKTNLKQMDSLMPLMMTAQDSSGSTAQDTDGQFLSRASVSTDSRQLSPPADAESSPCCPESTAGQIESSCDLSSVGKEEHKDRSYRKKSKDVGKNGEEVGPAPAVDSGTASEPSSCLQSMPDCEAKGTEGSPSCGIRNEETGTESAMATDQAALSSGDVVRPGVVVAAPDTGQHFSAGELVVSAAADASVPQTAGETGHGLVNPDATSQKNKGMEKKGEQAEEHGESAKGRLENSDLSAAGASGVRDTSTPVDKAGVPNCVSATSSVCGDKPAQSPVGFLSTEASIGKTADTGTSESRKESSAISVDQNSLVLPAAAEDKISDASEPDAPLANTCEAVSPSDLNFPRPQKDVMPKQKSETNSSHVQSKSPICSASGDDKLRAASTCQQSTVTSSGALAGKQHGDTVSQPGSTTTELPNTQHPPAAVCPEGSATFDHVRDTRGDVGFCSLEVSDKEGQGRDLKLETSLTNVLEVLPHPHAVVPKAKKEPVSDQALSSGRTFSLASSPGNESVTKDDVLSLVPSQKEKGTATSEPYNAADCEDGRDSCEPDKQPLEDSAAGLPTPPAALALPPSMGNASPVGFGGEQERPCPSAAPEVLSIEGDADCSLLRVGQAALASATSLTEKGKNPVVPESSAAQGQDDKDKAEAPGVCAEPSSNACAEDKALEGGSSWGTPLACLNAETKHNKEVAPPVSLLTEGGAARSLVPPGASLAADSSQEALCAEQSSSTPLQGLLPQGSEACNCDGSFALDVGVKETESLGASTAGEVRGNVAADAALASALQGTVEAGREAVSRDAHGLSTPEVLLNQGKNVILGLPEALPNKCATDLQGAASPEMVPLRWGKARLDGGDRSCSLGDSKDAQVGDDARLVPLQPTAETGVLTSEDKATGRERSAPPLPCAVSADARHLPETAGSIEEAASRIVDAVIERVKASGALLPEGETSHMSPSCPESGPVTEQLESASAGKAMAFLPGETQRMGSVHEEAPGNPAGCFAGREESEKILRPVQGSEPTTEMPDTKADDEVDFLSNIRESSVSEEVAAGDTVTTPKMTRQGPKTQAEPLLILRPQVQQVSCSRRLLKRAPGTGDQCVLLVPVLTEGVEGQVSLSTEVFESAASWM
ncbi:A-kinase anchor protein 13 [Pteropus alecto]|uniref:A-kinase anchor protein 13 n=1 Tax=Pteropus alecto TaxID=9402 RepID=L5L4P0_PTEAL|nr:A-kinase anchor protein 13 [Pteropus alecto]